MDAPAHHPEPSAAEEPRQALRGIMAAALDALRTRLDLAAVELELYLLALVRMLVWVIGALACALLALTFGVTALIAAFWDTHRMAALIGGSLVFVALAVVLGVLGVRTFSHRREAFEGTLQQLHEDTRRAGSSS